MTNTTTVLIAVARFELTPSIPIFANIEVRAANIADNNAKANHISSLQNTLFYPDYRLWLPMSQDGALFSFVTSLQLNLSYFRRQGMHPVCNSILLTRNQRLPAIRFPKTVLCMDCFPHSMWAETPCNGTSDTAHHPIQKYIPLCILYYSHRDW